MRVTVVCQVCFEKIAVADTEELRYPIRGSMFKSKDPEHGHPDPFPPSVEWAYMKCPYGSHRPFYVDDEITIDSGKARNPDILVLRSSPPVIMEEVDHLDPEKVQVFVTDEPEKKEEVKTVVRRPRRGRRPGKKKSARELILEETDVTT